MLLTVPADIVLTVREFQATPSTSDGGWTFHLFGQTVGNVRR
jgi:hypothetical protein